ncbi:MAG: hypothetical protein AB9915_02255 [Candidatus Dojkabacteria bacterium]
MSEAFGVVFGVLSVLLSLLSVVGVVYFVFYLVRNKDKEIHITTDTLLKVYLYLISFITLAVAVGGAAVFLNSAFSYKYGIPFSYNLEMINEFNTKESSSKPVLEEEYIVPECYVGEPTEVDGQRVCFDKETQKQGLVNGLTIAISMVVLFAIHKLGIYLSEKKSVLYWLKKTYTFVSLIVFSIVGVITIPIAAYQLSTYAFSRPEDITVIDPPGLALATVIFVLPLWIYFLVSTIKLKEEK